MERRKNEERRQVHVFVSNERRVGPYDRRGTESRRIERERERKKIESLRAYREKSNVPLAAAPMITRNRLLYLALALLVILVTLFLIR